MSAPIRRQQLDVSGFSAYLAGIGAEVGIPTNPYEMIRYKAFVEGATRAATHIIYAKENGLLTYTGESRAHYQTFMSVGELGADEFCA